MTFNKFFSFFSNGQSITPDDENQHKFGTFFGVFVPNVTMMFGVILFMRLCITVGYIPLWQYLVILGISLTVMVITSLSIAMITTNMQIGTGGAYYLISRSLGIEFGGAIGIGLVLSQIISLAVCTTGFAYTLSFIYPEISPLFIEFLTLLGLSLISFVSANLALKTQFFIFCLLLLSVGSIFFSNTHAYDTSGEMAPYFPEGLGFWGAFALVYPAMTGIEAGMALSGNLKNPSRSLWIGCLFSLVFVALTYAAVGVYFSSNFPAFALKSTPFLAVEISKIPELVYLGIWGATLSSALGNLLGSPRMIQSMAEDGIAPNIFKRTFGKHQEPRYALALTFVIALMLMMFTTIDQIIPIAAMICLLTYGFLNLSAGIADWIHSPTWRPLVHIPWYVSLLGAVLCFILMFMISAAWSIVAIALVVGLYVLMRSMSLDVPFKDIRENIIFSFSRFAVYHLSRTEDHPHHWHPQLLVFSKVPTSDLNIIHLSSSIASRSGILSIALIVPEAWEAEYQLNAKKLMLEEYLEKNSISGLVDVLAHSDYSEGVQNMIKSYGLGQLQPNTLVLKLSDESTEIKDIVSFLEAAKTYQKNTLLLWGDFEESDDLFVVPSGGKNIAIWWSPDDTTGFKLTLSYLHSLTSGTVWMGSNVTLHAVVFDENQKEHVDNNLQEFISQSRVRIDYRLHIEPKEVKQLNRYISETTNADLIFSSLRLYENNREMYSNYLQSLMSSLPDSTKVIFVSCYDSIDHSEIYG